MKKQIALIPLLLLLSGSTCCYRLHAQEKDIIHRISLQINRYSPLEIIHLYGPYTIDSKSTTSFQIGYSRNYIFRNHTGLSPELSAGVSPYNVGFYIPPGQVPQIDFNEERYRQNIRSYWYVQLSLMSAYSISVRNDETISFRGGIGIRRDQDRIVGQGSQYRPSRTAPGVRIFSLQTASREWRNMLTFPVGLYWEKPFAKRLFLNAGLRFTWLTRDWATGDYVFFPGYDQESRGIVSMGNYYLGIDLGFSWRKKQAN
ncbi:MAG: hypothetical protein MUC87_13275 [Bacteroidia bacterium]|jgi:hypothetical protein|nr:hypothetical protein [Bacteroidia bacterium]